MPFNSEPSQIVLEGQLTALPDIENEVLPLMRAAAKSRVGNVLFQQT